MRKREQHCFLLVFHMGFRPKVVFAHIYAFSINIMRAEFAENRLTHRSCSVTSCSVTLPPPLHKCASFPTRLLAGGTQAADLSCVLTFLIGLCNLSVFCERTWRPNPIITDLQHLLRRTSFVWFTLCQHVSPPPTLSRYRNDQTATTPWTESRRMHPPRPQQGRLCLSSFISSLIQTTIW